MLLSRYDHFPLLELDLEILLMLTNDIMDEHLPSALNFCAVCRTAWTLLEPARMQAKSRALHWELTFTSSTLRPAHWPAAHMLVPVTHASTSTDALGRSCCQVLPTAGTSSWHVRFCQVEKLVIGVGVVLGAFTLGWGLHPRSGMLFRCVGMDDERSPDGLVHVGRELPSGMFPTFPNGNGRRLLPQFSAGADDDDDDEIEVIWDANTHTLGFRVHGGSPFTALAGFPPGAPMRPFLAMKAASGASVHVSRYLNRHAIACSASAPFDPQSLKARTRGCQEIVLFYGRASNIAHVFDVIAAGELSDFGLHIDDIAAALEAVIPRDQVVNCIQTMNNDGFVYSTLDDDHFKATSI